MLSFGTAQEYSHMRPKHPPANMRPAPPKHTSCSRSRTLACALLPRLHSTNFLCTFFYVHCYGFICTCIMFCIGCICTCTFACTTCFLMFNMHFVMFNMPLQNILYPYIINLYPFLRRGSRHR